MRIWELMHVSTISLLYLQVGNCNQTTYQCPNCDNATQLVQPKHQQLVCLIPLTATKQPIRSINNYTVTMQPTHLVQPKHQHQVCPMPLVCMNVGTKSCSQNMGIELMQVPKTSLLYFKDAIATKEASSMQTATMQPMWQPKNQHLCVQYHSFA